MDEEIVEAVVLEPQHVGGRAPHDVVERLPRGGFVGLARHIEPGTVADDGLEAGKIGVLDCEADFEFELVQHEIEAVRRVVGGAAVEAVVVFFEGLMMAVATDSMRTMRLHLLRVKASCHG